MTAIVRVITWEFRRENRWWIVLAILAILGLNSLLYRTALPKYDSEDQILQFTIFVLEMGLIGMFLCTGQYNKAKSRLGFPEHLFTKPVRMRFVTGLRLTLAVAIAVLLYLLTAAAVYWTTGMIWSIVPACLYMTACVMFLHAMAWSLPAEPALQILLSTMGYLVLCMLYYDDLHSGPQAARLWGLLISIVLCAGLAIAGATLDRRSQRLDLSSLWDRITHALTACLPWRRCACTSPERALFWFHWIRKGWVLPGLSALAMILGFGLSWIPWAHRSQVITDYFMVIFFAHAFALPPLLGLILCQQETRNQGLATYLGTLPVPNRAMLTAYLKGCLASLVLAWGIFIMGLGILHLGFKVTGQGPLLSGLISSLKDMARAIFSIDGHPSVFQIAGIYSLAAWSVIGLTGSMILNGRRSVAIVVFAALFLWPILPALADNLGASSSTVVAIAVLEALCYILVAIVGTIAAFGYAVHKRLITSSLGIAALLIYPALILVNWKVLYAPRPLVEILGLMAILMLPVAPLATAPLALDWNRHR